MKIEGELRTFLQQRHGQRIDREELPSLAPFIAVGDFVSYTALRERVAPKLAVFDLYTERRPVPAEIRRALLSLSPLTVAVNPRGELREEFFSLAPSLAERGGGLYIIGEEDSLALPFLLTTSYPVIYGRRGEGMFYLSRQHLCQNLPQPIKELLKALQEKHSHV